MSGKPRSQCVRKSFPWVCELGWCSDTRERPRFYGREGRKELRGCPATNNPEEMRRGNSPSLAASCCWRTPRPPGPGTRAAPELWKCEEFLGMAVQLGWDSGNLWGIPGSSPKTELVELRAGRLGLSCCRVCGAAELSFTQLCGVAIKRGVKVKTFSWSCGSPQLVAPPTRGDFVVGRRREEFGGGIRNAGRGSAALASTELLQDVSQPVSSSPQCLIASSFQLRSNSFCLFFLRENSRFFCIILYYFSAPDTGSYLKEIWKIILVEKTELEQTAPFQKISREKFGLEPQLFFQLH